MKIQTLYRWTMFVGTLLVVEVLNIPAANAQGSAPVQTTSGLRGQTYASLKDLPDWGGAWGANGGGGGRGGQNLAADAAVGQNNSTDGGRSLREIPPLRDQEALAKYKAQLATQRQGDNVARQAAQNGGRTSTLKVFAPGMCGTGGGGNAAFAGRTSAGPEQTMEFLFTPGRVTILTDRSTVRRIYTDRPIPDDDARLTTLTGTSIGHWEGDTLVVATVGLSPHTVIAGGVQAGKGFEVDERMYLDEKHTMHIDGTIIAPDVYTEPYHYTQIYNRFLDRKYELAEYLTECDHVDRSIDRTKAEQQFDLTPPADLPPPPSSN